MSFDIVNTYDAVLFDMDGTLIDTEPVGPSVISKMAEQAGIEWTNEFEKEFDLVWRRVGTSVTTEQFVNKIFTSNGRSQEAPKFLDAFFLEYRHAITLSEQVPGADEFLRSLDCATAIVSGSDRAQINGILSAHSWTKWIDVVVPFEDYQEPKPSPAGYLRACRLLDVAPDRCVVFEDSEVGISSGKAAGMTVVAISYAKGNYDLSQADFVIEDFFGLI